MVQRRKHVSKKWLIAVFLFAALLVGCGLWALLAGKDIAVLHPQGIIAEQQKNLIIFTLLLSLIVVIPVFTMVALFVWKYRATNTSATYTPEVDGNRWIETLWWGIPIVIIAVLGYVTVVSTHALDPYKPLQSSVAPLRVQVIALQWKWLFLYPDQHIASLNELRIPTGTPVNFEITADAPMSSFWIPNLGSQTYAMTGMSSKLSLLADTPGTYRGTNTNINGKGYSDMVFNTVAVPSQSDFDTWVSSIESKRGYNDLEWDNYIELAKPSEKNPVTYYHLDDNELYSKIVNKYMPTHDNATGSMNIHDNNEEKS